MTEINVTAIYALADDQQEISLRCPAGSTIEAVIQLSGILQTHPEIDLDTAEVGVFGFKQDKDFRVNEGDRIEIYRPLLLSPTEARRLRAASRKNN